MVIDRHKQFLAALRRVWRDQPTPGNGHAPLTWGEVLELVSTLVYIDRTSKTSPPPYEKVLLNIKKDLVQRWGTSNVELLLGLSRQFSYLK